MNRHDFSVRSDYDGLEIKAVLFEPSSSPKGIVQLVHGMCEHKNRYENLMQFFAKHGYVCACHDHRGHGDSVLQGEGLGYFGDSKAQAIVGDTAKVTDYLSARYENLPITLFGYSMGSMVVRLYLKDYEDKIDKLIVCGSPSKNALSGVAIWLAKAIALFRGKRHRCKTLAYFSTGRGNKRFESEGKGAWLCSNKESVKSHRDDPKCRFLFTCNGYENLFRLLHNTYKKKGYKAENKDLPILFVSGADDPVLGTKEKWDKSVNFMKEVGYKNVDSRLYEGMRHEIYSETDKDKVLADLLQFIEK